MAYRPRYGWAARASWPSAVPGLDWTRAIVIPPCIIFGLYWGSLNYLLYLHFGTTWGWADTFLGGCGALSFHQLTNILVGVYMLVHLVALAPGRGRLAWMARLGCGGVLLFTVLLHVLYNLIGSIGSMHFVFPDSDVRALVVVHGYDDFVLMVPKKEFERSRNRIAQTVIQAGGKGQHRELETYLTLPDELPGGRFEFRFSRFQLVYADRRLRGGGLDFGPIEDGDTVVIRGGAVIVNGEIRGRLPSW